MKKLFIFIFSLVLLIPISANALTLSRNYETLEELVNHLELPKNKKGYKVKDDDVDIILFYGDGCPHCHEFIEFINSFDKEYDHISVYAYEVWYNSENVEFMNKVGKQLETEIRGVPFIIIGDKTFVGYGASMNSELKETIKSLYETPVKDRPSIFNSKETNNTVTTTTTTTQLLTTERIDDYTIYNSIKQQESFFNKYKVVIIITCVLILAIIIVIVVKHLL